MTYICKAVNNLYKKYHTTDVYQLCDLMNINLIKCPLPAMIRGFYSNILGDSYIYTSENLDEQSREAVIAHELGHAVLHPTVNSLFLSSYTNFAKSKFEYEADTFAAMLLLYHAKLDTFNTQETLSDFALRYGVPNEFAEIWFNQKNK